MANQQETPVNLPEACCRNLSDLCARLTDERLLIGSAPIMAEVRSKIYSSVIALWEVCASGRNASARSQLVRKAAQLLREGTEHGDLRRRTSVSAKSRASSATARAGFTACSAAKSGWRRTTIASASASSGAARNSCRRDDTITAIGIDSGFGSSQYFSRVFKKYVGVTPTDYRRLFGARPSQ